VLVFTDDDDKEIGNIGLHIAGAFTMARALTMCAISASGQRAAAELRKRADVEQASKLKRIAQRRRKAKAR
jgi:hypothetical protein